MLRRTSSTGDALASPLSKSESPRKSDIPLGNSPPVEKEAKKKKNPLLSKVRQRSQSNLVRGQTEPVLSVPGSSSLGQSDAMRTLSREFSSKSSALRASGSMVIGRDRAASTSSTSEELADEAIKKRTEEKLAAEQKAKKKTAEKIEKANIENKRAEIPEEMLPKRTHILNEIVSTELQYAWDLQVCVKYYYTVLRSKKLLGMLELSQLFSNMELVMEASKELGKALEASRAEAGVYAAIGEVFLSQVDYLVPVYANYCSNQQTALSTLERLKTKKKMAKFLAEAKQIEETRGLELEAFIIMPVQRICKYPLLFKDLMSATPAEHPDMERLQKAFDSVNQLVTVVNENSREANNLKRMKEISQGLSGAEHIKLIMPGRRFIHEGILYKISESGVQRERHFFLFSDMLIWARVAGKEKWEFKGMIPLRAFWYKALPDTDSLWNAWEMGRADSERKWIIFAKERNVKAMWMQVLGQVMEKLNRVSGFFTAVAFKINSEHSKITRTDTTHQLKLIDIQNRVEGVKDLVQDNRRFLREGPALGKNLEERFLFLFNDRLLVTKMKSPKRYTLKLNLPMENVVAGDVPDDDPTMCNCFALVRMDNRKKMIFMVESPEEKAAWLEEFDSITVGQAQNAEAAPSEKEIFQAASGATDGGGPTRAVRPTQSKQEVKKKLKNAAADTGVQVLSTDEEEDGVEKDVKKKSRKWDNDSSTTHCTECNSSFTTINRRHHCRNCGHIFCGDCTSKRAALKKLAYKKKVRVCDRCFINRERETTG